MKHLPTGLILAVTFAVTPLHAAEQTVRLSVPGMTCPSCPFIVEAAIGAVDGVITVTANSEIREAQVTFEDTLTSLDEISLAALQAGYEATQINTGS